MCEYAASQRSLSGPFPPVLLQFPPPSTRLHLKEYPYNLYLTPISSSVILLHVGYYGFNHNIYGGGSASIIKY